MARKLTLQPIEGVLACMRVHIVCLSVIYDNIIKLRGVNFALICILLQHTCTWLYCICLSYIISLSLLVQSEGIGNGNVSTHNIPLSVSIFLHGFIAKSLLCLSKTVSPAIAVVNEFRLNYIHWILLTSHLHCRPILMIFITV